MNKVAKKIIINTLVIIFLVVGIGWIAATLIGVVAIMIICLSFYGKKLRSV